MAVQARFYVAEVHKYPAGSGWADPQPMGKVIMRPVTRGAANSIWASATPSGLIELTIRGSALPWYEERLGKEIAVLMDDAPDEE